MNTSIRSALLVTALAVSAFRAGCQSPSASLKASDTVRVWAKPLLNGQEGIVRRVTADSIIIARPSRDARRFVDTPVSVSRVTRIDILEGRASSTGRKITGILLGSTAGAGLGALLGYHLGDDSCTDCIEFDTPETKRGINAFFGGVLGLAVGAVAGSVVGSNPVAKWKSVFP